MPTAENARLQYEGGQNSFPMSLLVDSGDHITFTSLAEQWSGRSGYAPDVKPDGLATGGVVTPAAANDAVDVASLTAYLGGTLASVVAAAGEAITRALTDVSKVNSITVTSAGAIAVLPGTDGTDQTFNEVRGAAGAPPYIPVGDIEIGQVRTTTSAAAPIVAGEIFQVIGLHQERYDFPVWEEIDSAGDIKFTQALDLIHTGDAIKGVYAAYAEPIYTDVQLATDFVPPETTHTQNSTQIYGGTIGSSTQSLNQGTFTAFLNNGVDDPLVTLKNENLWFKFFPDRYETPHILTQGKLGIARTFPAGDSIQAACTISANEEPLNVSA